MYRKIHAALVLILLAGLAACAPAPGKAIPTASATLLPSPSPTATITPLAWEGERLPGVDQGLSGELFTLPQDVFGLLREKGAAAIELDTGVVGGASNGLCSVAIAEQLTTGSRLQADGEGPAVYAFDGQKDQLAFWQNLPVPEGVSCVAFVAQDGNTWGLESGTVGVWFFTGGGKAGSTVINADNPLRVMISADNSASLSFSNNSLTMTTLNSGGQIIEEQKIAFLPPLPADFLSQVPKDSYTYDAKGLHITVAEGRVIDILQNEIADKLVIGVFDNLQILNTDKTLAAWAYDKENKVWIDGTTVIQPNMYNVEGYIHIQTWDDLQELTRKEKLVLIAFPPDTYFPPLDQIFVDYENTEINDKFGQPFNFWNPLGSVTDLNKAPIRRVNFILVKAGEGRRFDDYIVSEQVFNPQDGTFSILNFGFSEFEQDYGWGTLQHYLETPDKFLLPGYMYFQEVLGGAECYTICNEVDYLKSIGAFDAEGNLPEIKALLREWFSTGRVPDKLESFLHVPSERTFSPVK